VTRDTPGRREERQAAERAVAAHPGEPRPLARLGDAWLEEDRAAAERHYRASLALDPLQPPVLNNLGVALLGQRRAAEAALAFKAAVRLAPTDSLAKLNLFRANVAVLRRSPWTWATASLSVPIVALALWSGSLHGRDAALVLGGAAALLALQLLVARRARAAGLVRLSRIDPQLTELQRHLEQDLAAGREVLAPAWQRRLGLAVAAFGAVTLVAALAGAAYQLHEYLGYPPAPRRTTLETSGQGEWVVLEGISLDCRTAQLVHGHGYVVGRSAGGRQVVSTYRGALECDRSPRDLEGVVSDLRPRLAAALAEAGFPIPLDRPAELCTGCGPGGELALLAMALLLGVVGGYLLWSGARLARLASRVRRGR
jgi:hypothetical protein